MLFAVLVNATSLVDGRGHCEGNKHVASKGFVC